MRWPIATGSSMSMVAFQNHDELVRTSLYKGGSHPAVIQLKARAIDYDARCVLSGCWWVGRATLGPGLAIVWSPSFVDQTIGENGATTILGYSVTATPITTVL